MEGSEGTKIRFDCRVIGHPTPQIKWYKGRQKIESSTDFQVSGDVTTLKQIKKGVYGLHAKGFLMVPVKKKKKYLEGLR